ncbi:MAG TPA: methyltransferase, partial [Candidatus Binatus sp.]|nr:methyltransferase [Candidatus Binatus sp.]
MKRTGLQVSPPRGERTIELLNDLELVDHRFKIGRRQDKLLIPLLREPTSIEREMIEDKIGEFETVEADYEPQPERPETLEAALSLLPPEVRGAVPKAFDTVGDIVVVELDPEMQTYKTLIGEALMTVHKNIKAVYAKGGPITGDERIRPLEHLAGEHRTTTIHREFGCNFKVDLARAFYSPRLSSEHKRVADLVQPKEHVIDMFAGVGPFSILIAKRLDNVKVEAIDHNPDASNLLKENVKMNHVEAAVRVWNEDARIAVNNSDLRGTANRV